ncbi:MAG: hypothetical protein RL205_682 [Actinomycetota bacterium]
MFDSVQSLVILAIWLVVTGLQAWALIDCVRRPAQAFPAIDRKSKTLWLALTGAALGTGLLFRSPFGIFGIAGAVIALVYLVDVRPKIIEIMKPRW